MSKYLDLIRAYRQVHSIFSSPQEKDSCGLVYYLIGLFNKLKENDCSEIDEETAKAIIDSLLMGSKLSNFHQLKLSTYLIYYIKYFEKLMLTSTPCDVQEKIQEQTNTDDINIPVDIIPKKEIDTEWEKLLEMEKLISE